MEISCHIDSVTASGHYFHITSKPYLGRHIMFLKTWRLITLILAALSVGMAFCHTLELPAKMQYDATLWTTINQSLYQQFGSLPGIFSEVGAVLAAIGLTVLVRKRRPAFYWTLAGAVLLTLSLVVWFTLVAPMNAEFAQWTVNSIPANWMQVRNQWEYSHAARFVLQLIGLCTLQISLLVEIPTTRPRNTIPPEIASLTRH